MVVVGNKLWENSMKCSGAFFVIKEMMWLHMHSKNIWNAEHWNKKSLIFEKHF
jgi:hypothetical protein